MNEHPLTLLYFAHLKWNHVWQRPQQLMTRFAGRCRVIYFDPPELSADAEQLDMCELPGVGGVRVFQPIFPKRLMDTPGNSYQEMWARLLPTAQDLGGPNTIVWVSSPYADWLAARLKPSTRLVVYDCMDDLASFRDGTPDMPIRELNLLASADLVFTGGHSMYQARKDRHPRVYCFPSGVDIEHYRQVNDPDRAIPPAIAGIPRPQLGYFGVLDERIDWPMIAEVAARRPDWQWVLVGPTAKVTPDELPEAPNIHYLGQQAYNDLPGFLKSFDIATMPFALNDATRFISPTKTLEYLAGGKPVISSSVPDVVAFYSEIVKIADGADAWEAAIEQILQAPAEALAARRDRAAPILESSTWDSIVDRMWRLMEEHIAPA